MITWNEQFETGSELIDQQHQMWILNINHLEALLANTNPTRAECELLLHVVDFLENYAEAHFALEEDCMACNRCPAHRLNQKAHAAYRIIFSNYRRQCAIEGVKPELLRKLHATASLWVREHILKIDTRLRPYVLK